MNDYLSSCHAKTRFLTRKAAKHRASQIRREGGPHFRTYHCRHCGLYHVGGLRGHASHLRTVHGRAVPVEELTP